MENGKTDSCALVPVETVDVELIFEPRPDELQRITGYGSCKIIRESILNQLKIGYAVFRDDGRGVKKKKMKLTRHEKLTNLVMDTLNCGECLNRNDVTSKTGLSKLTVIRILNELADAGLVDEGTMAGVYYYRIALK